jgi:hypothetical protein
MQILYIGNGHFRNHGSWYYDVGRKLVNGFVRNGHNVYFFSDRDTARSAALFHVRPLGIRACNRAFVETCINFSPDLIVFFHADIIDQRALTHVQERLPRVKMAQVNVDPVFRPHNQAMIRSKLPFMDATFITTAGSTLKQFHNPNGHISFIPNPVDPSIEWPRCHEDRDQKHDVFWAMRSRQSSQDDPRIQLPIHLERSHHVAIDYHGMNGRPELSSYQYYQAISQARMGLNISVVRSQPHSPHASSEELYLYSSDRISHYLGSGLLVLSTRDNQLEHLFEEDKEMVFFQTADELLEKVIALKKHESQRQAIAYAGWKKAHECFNSQRVARYIVESTFHKDNPNDYPWPTEKY